RGDPGQESALLEGVGRRVATDVGLGGVGWIHERGGRARTLSNRSRVFKFSGRPVRGQVLLRHVLHDGGDFTRAVAHGRAFSTWRRFAARRRRQVSNQPTSPMTTKAARMIHKGGWSACPMRASR